MKISVHWESAILRAPGDAVAYSVSSGPPTGPGAEFFRNNTQSAGSTSKVSMVDETMPPMTTVASGRCTSAPAPVATAIGTKSSEATSAVMSTGRNTRRDFFSKLLTRSNVEEALAEGGISTSAPRRHDVMPDGQIT